MNIPKVSICMITYNHEKFIEQAIESVLMQEMSFDYELVIGDDCSTDNTRSICERYQRDNPGKINLLPKEENIGMIKNLIRTLRACNGTYIALLEGDDYWTSSNKLQKQIDFLESNKSFAICFHRMKVIYEEGSQQPFLTKEETEITTIKNLAWGNYIYTASCVFRNNLFKDFPESFYTSPVGDYFLHMLNAQYGDIMFINEVMGVYRIHENGVWGATDGLYQITKWVKLQDALMDVFTEEVRDILMESQKYNLKVIAETYKKEGDPNGYILKNLPHLPKSFFPIVQEVIELEAKSLYLYNQLNQEKIKNDAALKFFIPPFIRKALRKLYKN